MGPLINLIFYDLALWILNIVHFGTCVLLFNTNAQLDSITAFFSSQADTVRGSISIK